MATWLQHIKLAFGGPLGANLDEWSCSVRFKANADRGGNVASIALTGSQLDAALTDLVAPLGAWFHRVDTGINAGCTMTWAKLNMVGSNGKQLEANTHLREFPAVTGGLGGGAPPWYQTLALTMRTDYRRGRGHSGRIFPPLVGYATEAGTPYVSVAQVNSAASSWATALDQISSKIALHSPIPQADLYPVIASAATNVGPDPGGAVLLPVTGIVVDRVHDVQHRRTNRVPRAEGQRYLVVGANPP